MKQIQFNNKEYGIPEAWSEVTVDMLIKAAELAEILEAAPIIAIISAYTGIDARELKLTKTTEVQDIILIMEFISTPYEPIPATGFEHQGVEYNCEDELVNQKFEDWVSIQTAMYNNREQQERALPRLLAILCKKAGETLDDIDLDERTEIMRSLPMTAAKDVEAFFLHNFIAYKSLILLSSTIKEQEALVLNKVQDLQNTMKIRKAHSGMFSGTRLLIGIYQLQLLWVKKVVLEKYFNSEHSKSSKNTSNKTYKTLVQKWLNRKGDGNSNSTL